MAWVWVVDRVTDPLLLLSSSRSVFSRVTRASMVSRRPLEGGRCSNEKETRQRAKRVEHSKMRHNFSHGA